MSGSANRRGEFLFGNVRQLKSDTINIAVAAQKKSSTTVEHGYAQHQDRLHTFQMGFHVKLSTPCLDYLVDLKILTLATRSCIAVKSVSKTTLVALI